MTTKELKQYIDKVLGNSIRCLLPSYWWKRLFGMVVDKVDEVDAKVKKKIGASDLKTINGESIVGEGDIKIKEGDNPIIVLDNGTTQKNADAFKKILHAYENDLGVLVLYKEDAVDAFVKQFYTTRKIACANDKIYLNFTKDNDSSDKIYQYTLSADGKLSYRSSWNETTIDEALSDTSTNAVQNKAIKAYVDEQVAKAGGGSSVDVDTELSNMSTNPVQNKVITNAINAKADNTRVDLISERLDDIDGEMKDFATESQLNNKQDVITDLDTIRQGAAKGATALQSIPSEYVTESELNSKGYATTSQVNAKQDSITDLGEIRRGAGLGATALQSVPSEYITEAELNAKNYATATQLTAKQDTISDIAAIREGASKGMTALQSYKEGGLEYIAVDGLMDKDGAYWFLPGVNDDEPAHTFAMLSDLQGGVSQEDFDTLYDGVVEAEEVAAAALNDLNDRLGKLAENVQGETVTKEDFETAVNNLNESLSGKADAQTTSEALTALSGQVETLSGQVETAVTSKQLSSAIDNVNNTILENEEITAAALVDLNTKITDILERLNNAGL